MSNELARIEFNPEQVELIKNTIAKDATNDELKLFLYQCQRTGLDPMTRQIYFMKRGGKVTIQTSIDGFRVIAERSGDYGGQDEPIFVKEEGDLYCKVTVYRFRGEIRYPAAVGVAYWKEYCPASGQDFMWKKMPHTMLAKVAEALALRKAYPQDLSGLYTNDEMNQADQKEAVKQSVNAPDEGEKRILRNMVYNTDLGPDEKERVLAAIDLCWDYETFQKIQFDLENRQQSIDQIPNPSQKDINNHLKKSVK
jgi:phage recombination protein Bet